LTVACLLLVLGAWCLVLGSLLAVAQPSLQSKIPPTRPTTQQHISPFTSNKQLLFRIVVDFSNFHQNPPFPSTTPHPLPAASLRVPATNPSIAPTKVSISLKAPSAQRRFDSNRHFPAHKFKSSPTRSLAPTFTVPSSSSPAFLKPQLDLSAVGSGLTCSSIISPAIKLQLANILPFLTIHHHRRQSTRKYE